MLLPMLFSDFVYLPHTRARKIESYIYGFLFVCEWRVPDIMTYKTYEKERKADGHEVTDG